MSSPQWRFADFRLDPDHACLWRGTQPLVLTPKAFDVLHWVFRSVLSASINAAFRLKRYESPYNSSS